MTQSKKSSGKKGGPRKKPVLVADLAAKAAKPRASAGRTPKPAATAEPKASPDAYGFVSERYQSLARTWQAFQGQFKKHPIRALQDMQFRALALVSKAIPRGKKKRGDKPDYGTLRREWLKRRLLQAKPVRAIQSKLGKKS
jgi:hypothetical protein